MKQIRCKHCNWWLDKYEETCPICKKHIPQATPSSIELDLLFLYRMKRGVDGLNGRTWSSSQHLKHEEAIVKLEATLKNKE